MGTPPEHGDFRFMPDMVRRNSGCLCPPNPYIFHAKCPIHKHLVSVIEAEPKPKSVAEEIWGWLGRAQMDGMPTNNTMGEELSAEWRKTRTLSMALAEAVEWIDAQSHAHPKIRVVRLGSILRILQGEKTREIPKPDET